MTAQADAIRAALHEWAFESHDADDDDLAADVRELLAALKAETERADKHCTHVLELLTERDVAKEQHANTLNRMLRERAEHAARCQDLEAALARLADLDDQLNGQSTWAFARAALATVAAPPTLTEADNRIDPSPVAPSLPGEEALSPSDGEGTQRFDASASVSAVRDVPGQCSCGATLVLCWKCLDERCLCCDPYREDETCWRDVPETAE